MLVVCDCPGSEVSPDHGYTKDDGTIHYWMYDRAEDDLSFRENPGETPLAVKEATREWLYHNR